MEDLNHPPVPQEQVSQDFPICPEEEEVVEDSPEGHKVSFLRWEECQEEAQEEQVEEEEAIHSNRVILLIFLLKYGVSSFFPASPSYSQS